MINDRSSSEHRIVGMALPSLPTYIHEPNNCKSIYVASNTVDSSQYMPQIGEPSALFGVPAHCNLVAREVKMPPELASPLHLLWY
jgi:hypothetical protein